MSYRDGRDARIQDLLGENAALRDQLRGAKKKRWSAFLGAVWRRAFVTATSVRLHIVAIVVGLLCVGLVALAGWLIYAVVTASDYTDMQSADGRRVFDVECSTEGRCDVRARELCGGAFERTAWHDEHGVVTTYVSTGNGTMIPITNPTYSGHLVATCGDRR